MNRAFRLAAVVAPALGLAAMWATSHQTYQQGTEWEVPIMGYDPRDYLRGHYVEFTYDWPGNDELGDIIYGALCLEGEAPVVAHVAWLQDGQKCDHPVRADASGVYQSDGLWRGRLYLGQVRAEALQRELQDQGQRGIVTIRQRDDGSFTPVSIRFRPLTPAEVAERAPQDAAIPPPPMLSEPTGNPPPSPQSAP